MLYFYTESKKQNVSNVMVPTNQKTIDNSYGCYDSKILKLANKRNLVLELTQENSIENSV